MRRIDRQDAHAVARLVNSRALIMVMALPAAMRQLKDAKAGYPTGGDASGDGTSRTEALGIAFDEGRPDHARVDETRLLELLSTLAVASKEAANIVARWHDGTTYTVLDIATSRTGDDWCKNCIVHGAMSPRKAEHSNCSWCVAFHHHEGWWPVKALVDLHAQGRRISQVDIDRHRPAKRKRGRAA